MAQSHYIFERFSAIAILVLVRVRLEDSAISAMERDRAIAKEDEDSKLNY